MDEGIFIGPDGEDFLSSGLQNRNVNGASLWTARCKPTHIKTAQELRRRDEKLAARPVHKMLTDQWDYSYNNNGRID